MENTNNIQNKIIDDILKIDFSGCENILNLISLIGKIELNENNREYTESIRFLHTYVYSDYSYFNSKYKNIKTPEEVLEAISNIIDKIKNDLVQLKLATVLLMEYKKINKLNMAKFIIKKTILFLDKKKYKNFYELDKAILFALDLNYKFNLEEEFNYTKQLKDAIKSSLYNKECDIKIINLLESLIKKHKIYTKDELEIIKLKLNEILEIDKSNIIFLHKILVLLDPNDKENICQIIIDEYLLKKTQDNTTKQFAFYFALKYARETNNKKQLSIINSIMKKNNKENISCAEDMRFDIPEHILEQFRNRVNSFLDFYDNLYDCVVKFYPSIKVNFEAMDKMMDPVVKMFYSQTMYIDTDNLNEKYDDGSFMEYSMCLCISYFWINILKTELLQNFYPNKEYFYSLTYNNNIIPKGYEEIIARMLYAGIHKDYMDFFIYASVSIEAILRHIIDEDVIKNNKKNHQIQEYETLENLLGKIKEQNLLEEDTVKELRLLFCKDGYNIRNNIAHARFSQDIFDRHCMVADYMWCFLVNFFIKNRNYNKKPK
ncbi:DUF4209 domain-containing protein [Campylobacter lari]|uniref:DUF4209 domain-containing protein n=2 Tax=Campylobacter lari TaxID=201 RepID=UPI002932F4CC|nr:DUF4209 domain-containing protein [Campylobacter lari]